MRPQGYDFRWGSLRWCETSGGNGCFDAEHVALHEFGHAMGWTIRSAGHHLPASSTVMHQVTPAKPDSAWNRHAFGSCDVASLQEQYGLPTMSTTITECNDVQTTISPLASDTSLAAGEQVTFKATLRVKGRLSVRPGRRHPAQRARGQAPGVAPQAPPAVRTSAPCDPPTPQASTACRSPHPFL
ncbi:MAG: hypothetical protein R3C32_06550 [Chloroflexota bacterium]